MALPVAELNDILATVPINGDYNLQAPGCMCYTGGCVSVAGQMGFARTQQGRLQIAAGQAIVDGRAGCASSPRTTLSFQSTETVQRLVAGGKRAALPLVARGQLRVEGDLGQLEELRRELQPHMSRLQAAAEALMSSETTAVRWLPDEATECCMAESCGRPFTLLRRRHHCRGCGQIFCDTCSPLRGAPAQRRCASCWAKKTAPALGPMGLMGPMPEALTAGDSSPALPKDKGSTTDLLVEFHVEDSLQLGADGFITFVAFSFTARLCDTRQKVSILFDFQPSCDILRRPATSCDPRASIRFWWRASAALSSACVIGFLATFTQERLLMLSPLLLVAFFLRRWLLRYAEVAWLCTVIFTKIFSARLRASGRPPQAAEAIWALCHKVCARFVFDTVVSLGGFWVKLAQTASVVSALHDAYVDELSKLQDSMPADSLELVEKLLTKELGSTWREHIQLDPGPVLGSATIAQVHKATFRLPKDGGVQEIQGVVKVQHAHVEEKLLVDIRASVLVGRLMTSLMPHMFSDVGATIQDTAAMSKAELDFRMEARNQEMARARIQEAGLDITVPAVIPEYVTKRVLAMEFVKGVKITEYAKAESSTARRKEVMAKLIDFYGFTLHGPIFNCDPHPGNILVDKETGRLCVLDWGQVRQLSQPERFAYAKIFMAALMEDVHLFVEGCRALDFEFGDLDGPPDATPIAMIGALRFLLRDSRPIAQSRADFEQLEQVFGKLDGETKAIQKGLLTSLMRRWGANREGSLDAFDKDGLPVSLLFEVSSRLEVCHGYPMLLKEQGHTNVKVQPSMTSFTLKLPVMQQSLGTGSDLGLVSKFSQLLRALHADGHLLGAQLCVLDLATGATLVDLALGHSSWLNPLPVTTDTLFNILEISKMFLSFSVPWLPLLKVLRLVEQGRVSLKTVLQESSKGKVSLENALSHTSGHLKLAPGGSELSFRDFCDMDVLAKKMVAEEPLLAPGAGWCGWQTSKHALFIGECDAAVALSFFSLRPAGLTDEEIRDPTFCPVETVQLSAKIDGSDGGNDACGDGGAHGWSTSDPFGGSFRDQWCRWLLKHQQLIIGRFRFQLLSSQISCLRFAVETALARLLLLCVDVPSATLLSVAKVGCSRESQLETFRSPGSPNSCQSQRSVPVMKLQCKLLSSASSNLRSLWSSKSVVDIAEHFRKELGLEVQLAFSSERPSLADVVTTVSGSPKSLGEGREQGQGFRSTAAAVPQLTPQRGADSCTPYVEKNALLREKSARGMKRKGQKKVTAKTRAQEFARANGALQQAPHVTVLVKPFFVDLFPRVLQLPLKAKGLLQAVEDMLLNAAANSGQDVSTRSHGLFQEGDGAYADYTGFDAIYDGLGYAGGGESSAIATHVYHVQDDILVRPHSGQLGRYPALKFIISGKPTESGEVPQVLVKANIRPSVVPELDSLLLLQEVLLRECWRNASGVVPESLVVPGLSGREIALSLPGPKRGLGGSCREEGREGWVEAAASRATRRNALLFLVFVELWIFLRLHLSITEDLGKRMEESLGGASSFSMALDSLVVSAGAAFKTNGGKLQRETLARAYVAAREPAQQFRKAYLTARGGFGSKLRPGQPRNSFESESRSSLHGLRWPTASVEEPSKASAGLRRRSGACSSAALGNGLKLQRSSAAKILRCSDARFEHFIDATNRGKSKTATAGQKAEHGMWMSFFGREHWFNPAALNREIPKTHVLPGRQAFATAKDTAKALRAAHGTCLSQRMWNEAARSRKPPKGGDSEPCRLPHHLERFQNAEWGLGLQRLRLPDDREVLGHAACNGSFAVLLPNQSRPVVAAFLVNRSDGAVAAERILSALAEM
ncbi:unnamed protein product [Cladocopium goreaui]|uniref:Uncharacterized protein sll1770 n=1 Tax=Cladocopium goreaui TaxID=2562237 RepID=A0A9P1DQ73_9DINO|nr:unnamed protein product [Cladocopium goreaui]